MNNKLLCQSIASLMAVSYYNRLIDLSYSDMEDSIEFADTIDALKRIVPVENAEYLKLDGAVIDNYFKIINDKMLKSVLDGRMYLKLKNMKRRKEGSRIVGDNDLLSDIISSKITVDFLKETKDFIENLDSVDDDNLMILNMYYKRYVIQYLSSNSYAEKIALGNDYNLERIKLLDYSEIEQKYNLVLTKYLQNIFVDYIIGAVTELSKINSGDQNYNMIQSIMQYSRVKATLPNVNKESLIKISEKLKKDISFDRNPALVKVKKMIDKRKEELN